MVICAAHFNVATIFNRKFAVRSVSLCDRVVDLLKCYINSNVACRHREGVAGNGVAVHGDRIYLIACSRRCGDGDLVLVICAAHFNVATIFNRKFAVRSVSLCDRVVGLLKCYINSNVACRHREAVAGNGVAIYGDRIYLIACSRIRSDGDGVADVDVFCLIGTRVSVTICINGYCVVDWCEGYTNSNVACGHREGAVVVNSHGGCCCFSRRYGDCTERVAFIRRCGDGDGFAHISRSGVYTVLFDRIGTARGICFVNSVVD